MSQKVEKIKQIVIQKVLIPKNVMCKNYKDKHKDFNKNNEPTNAKAHNKNITSQTRFNTNTISYNLLVLIT